MSEPVLCYVDGPWAYFTTAKLEDQWGDDWNDAPYEHNAGRPYEWREGSKGPRYEITHVAFEASLEAPSDAHCNSPWSVEQINKKCVPWLVDRWGKSGVEIFAGATLAEFTAQVEKAGGSVYRRVVERERAAVGG